MWITKNGKKLWIDQTDTRNQEASVHATSKKERYDAIKQQRINEKKRLANRKYSNFHKVKAQQDRIQHDKMTDKQLADEDKIVRQLR